MRRDPVTPLVAKAVLARDGGCIAPRVDSDAGPCWGRVTLDHVHDEHGIGKRRAKSDPAHLVSVCIGHSEGGARAGHVWNTSHRAEERAYLAAKERA